MFNEFLTVPDDCATPYLLPALPADPNCVLAPDLSQINYIIFSPCTAADPLTVSGSTVSLVSGAIDNDNADNTKTRLLLVEGEIPEHEVIEVEGPNRTTLIPKGGRSYELSVRAIITDPLTYEFYRSLQADWKGFRIWYQDLAGHIYGKIMASGASSYGGIRPSFVNVQFPKGGGRDDRNYATLIIRWDADADPPRYTSPISVADGCAPA